MLFTLICTQVINKCLLLYVYVCTYIYINTKRKQVDQTDLIINVE